MSEGGQNEKQEESHALHENIKMKDNTDLEIENVESEPEYLEELVKFDSVKEAEAQNWQIEDIQKVIASDNVQNTAQVECAQELQIQGESQGEFAGEIASTEMKNEGEISQDSHKEQSENEAAEKLEQSKLQRLEYVDGIYAGKGEGKKGKIKLEVTIANGRIDEINVISHNETEGFYNRSADKTIDAIISSQSAYIDAVSGSTRTSNGIKDAVKEALEKAKKNE